jgi:hypothetical protein
MDIFYDVSTEHFPHPFDFLLACTNKPKNIRWHDTKSAYIGKLFFSISLSLSFALIWKSILLTKTKLYLLRAHTFEHFIVQEIEIQNMKNWSKAHILKYRKSTY